MGRKRPDYGKRLSAFGRGTSSRPVQGNRADIRLPSWERLLAIDAEAEADAARARIRVLVAPHSGPAMA